MNTPTPYDPEDIESLMLHKRFEELYPEEREFVLRHVDGADEYESMRRMLHDLLEDRDSGGLLEPDPAIRRNLMAMFPSEERSGFRIWLNSLLLKLWPPALIWYRTPAFQLAFSTAALLLAVWVIWPAPGAELAQNRVTPAVGEKEALPTEADSLVPAAPAEVQPVETETDLQDHQDQPVHAESSTEMEITDVTPGAYPPVQSDDYSDDKIAKAATAPNNTADGEGLSVFANQAEKSENESVEAMSESKARNRKSNTNKIQPPVSSSMHEVDGLLDVLYTAR